MNPKKLIKELKRKLRKDPQNESWRLQLAQLYSDSDQYAEAADVLYELGYHYYQQKHLDRAQQMAKRTLELVKDHPQATELLKVVSLERHAGRASSEVDERVADGNWVPTLAGQRSVTSTDVTTGPPAEERRPGKKGDSPPSKATGSGAGDAAKTKIGKRPQQRAGQGGAQRVGKSPSKRAPRSPGKRVNKSPPRGVEAAGKRKDSDADGRVGKNASKQGGQETQIARLGSRKSPGKARRGFEEKEGRTSPVGVIAADDSAAILMTPTPLPLPLSEHEADDRDSVAYIDIKRYNLPLNIDPSGPLPSVSLPDDLAPVDDDLLTSSPEGLLPTTEDVSDLVSSIGQSRVSGVASGVPSHRDDDEDTGLVHQSNDRLRTERGPARSSPPEPVRRPRAARSPRAPLTNEFDDDAPTQLASLSSMQRREGAPEHRLTTERSSPLRAITPDEDAEQTFTREGPKEPGADDDIRSDTRETRPAPAIDETESSEVRPADTKTDIPQMTDSSATDSSATGSSATGSSATGSSATTRPSTDNPFALWSDTDTRDTARKMPAVRPDTRDTARKMPAVRGDEIDTARYAAQREVRSVPSGVVPDNERTVRVSVQDVAGFNPADYGIPDALDEMADQLDGLPMVIHDDADISSAMKVAQVAPEPEPRHEPLQAFADLPGEALNELSSRMTLRHYSADSYIIRQDERADACFSLVSGRVLSIRYEPAERDSEFEETGRMGGGDLFGESSLLPARRYRASVRVMEECSAYEIPRRTLRELAAVFPGVDSALEQVYRDRLLDSLIATHPFLRGLKKQKQHELRNRFQVSAYESGQSLMREGEPSGGLYLVVAGALEVTKRLSRKRAVLLATLEEGAYLSDMSSLRNAPSCATVSAAGPVELAVLPAKPFKRVLDSAPELWNAICAERGRRALERNHILIGSSNMV